MVLLKFHLSDDLDPNQFKYNTLIYFDLKQSKKCRIAGVYHLMLLLHPFQGASYVRRSSTKLSTQEMTWHFSCSCTSKQSS